MCNPGGRAAHQPATATNTPSPETNPPVNVSMVSPSDDAVVAPDTTSPRQAVIYADEAIRRSGLPLRNATDLIHGLVSLAESEVSEIAAQVTNLQIVHHYMPYEIVPPSIAALRLPSLRTLELTAVIVTPRSLIKLIRKHSSTVKVIRLNCVALAIPRMDATRASEKTHCWKQVIERIGKKGSVEYLLLNSLTWCDANSGKMCDTYLSTPYARYGWRSLHPEEQIKFKLSNGGLEAIGYRGVKYGIGVLLRELNGGRCAP